MSTQGGLKGKLHPSEVILAKKNWRLLKAGPNLSSTKQERADFLQKYANCKEVMDYVRLTQQPVRESYRTHQHI